jgi:hypothetical protein
LCVSPKLRVQGCVVRKNYEQLAGLHGVPVRDTVKCAAGYVLRFAECSQGPQPLLMQSQNCMSDGFVSIGIVRRGAKEHKTSLV